MQTHAPFTMTGLALLLAVWPGMASATGAGTTQMKGDAELGQHLARECVTCHQLSGRVTANVPAIIAWPQDQFIAVLQAYRDKQREHEAMRAIASTLSDEDMAALAVYFGALSVRAKTK